MDITTMRITKQTKKKFRECSFYSRETDEEVLLRLIDNYKEMKK